MDHDDEFDFSDDGFDDLPPQALQQLETEAILATQQQARHNAPESDYGGLDDGDEVINLDDEVAVPQASPWVAVAGPQFTNAPPQQYSYPYANSNGAYHDAMEVEEQPQRSQADPSQLLLRIKKLEQDKARLNRDLQSEKSRLMAKSGEAETARRRLDATTRENNQKLSALQQSHNEALAKQKAEVEKLRREREQAQTNNMFLEHDLAREADKAKRMKRNLQEGIPSRPKQNAARSPSGTPKRQQKSMPFRNGDGFDDDDIVMASPTKNRAKSKASTPKQASKRKRQVTDDSPIPALQLSEPRERPKPQEPLAEVDKFDPVLLAGLKTDDHRFQLLYRLVNNRSSNGVDRVLEALTQYALPSKPEKKLSSLVYDQLSLCSLQQNVHDLALQICHIFLNIWDECLKEKYYAPIYLFLDALQFILAYEPCSTAVAVTERAVSMITASVDLVSVPLAGVGTGQTSVAQLYSPAQRNINSDIDVMDCLDLLYLIATSCTTSIEATTHFWEYIHWEFALVLLNKVQPLEHVILMLRILGTSALPNTIGMVTKDDSTADKQEKKEVDLINRLTQLLSDTPEIIQDPDSTASQSLQYSAKRILDLRIQILGLLTTFSISEHGCARLANNRFCIGRLIKFLDEQITSLYTDPLSSIRPLVIASINTTMKLIYHLKTSHPEMNIRSKLNVIQGGSHKYLVSLTRLAFSEGLVLEEGIEQEVVDAANDILDEGLTPEEGEGLLQVFSSVGSV